MGRSLQLRANNGGQELAPELSITDSNRNRRMTVILGKDMQDLVDEPEEGSVDNSNDSEQNRKAKVAYPYNSLVKFPFQKTHNSADITYSEILQTLHPGKRLTKSVAKMSEDKS